MIVILVVFVSSPQSFLVAFSFAFRCFVLFFSFFLFLRVLTILYLLMIVPQHIAHLVTPMICPLPPIPTPPPPLHYCWKFVAVIVPHSLMLSTLPGILYITHCCVRIVRVQMFVESCCFG